MDQPAVTSPAPVNATERLLAVDVLRGFAVLGLMMVHITVFSRPLDPLGDISMGLPVEGANRAFLWITHVLVSSKFMFLFALLFGAGVMFFDRKSTTGKLSDGAGLWYSRMGWLAAIGLAHGVLLFFGDILFTYAVAGMVVLWWVRKLKPSVLVAIGSAMYVLGAAVLLGMMALIIYFMASENGSDAFADGLGHAAQMEGYLGTYLESTRIRLLFLLNNLIMLPFVTIWMVSGIMLLGMALTKWGVLTGMRSARFYAAWAGIGIAIGLPLSTILFAWVERGDFSNERSLWFAGLFQPAGVALALGYLGLVMLVVKKQWLMPVQKALAAVGRMALSNYLLHSLLGAWIFQGWGLGLYGDMQYPALFGIVLSVWAVNIAGSLVWLRYFRFGPAEWLWRSLTYRKLQPIWRA